MKAVIAAVEATAAATAPVAEEASETITTTLYDLIAALQAVAGPGEESLVVAAVVHLLRSEQVVFLGAREELGSQAPLPCDPGHRGGRNSTMGSRVCTNTARDKG